MLLELEAPPSPGKQLLILLLVFLRLLSGFIVYYSILGIPIILGIYSIPIICEFGLF